MLFASIPLALVTSLPWLVSNMTPTLVYSALSLNVAQILRSILRLGSDAYSAVLMGVLTLLLAPVISAVLVLFGAPVVNLQVETALAGLVISVLAVQPLLAVHGLDASAWREAASGQLPPSDVYYGSIGTLVGAWAGAVPISLDWDRPWQAYPITIVVGAYIGAGLGTIIGGFYSRARAAPSKTRATKKRKIVVQ